MNKSQAPNISIVIPMYNEKDYIEDSINCLVEALKNVSSDYEIIIVDDASDDGSGEIADELARKDNRIRVIHNHINKKLGGSLRAGFEKCSKSLVLYIDADIPCDPRELEKALRIMRLTKSDIVSAYRLDRTAEGFNRTFCSFSYNLILKLMFGERIRDVNFAFKLFKREILKRVYLHSEGSFIDAELLIKSTRAGYKLTQFGVDYFMRMRGTSQLWNADNILKIIAEMLAYRFRHL